MLFPLSSFRFCSPLKNDGRGELRFGGTVNDFLYKKRKCLNRKLSPLVGESVSGADERGKCEKKRQDDFYRAALNTCLSFLNEVKNLRRGCKI